MTEKLTSLSVDAPVARRPILVVDDVRANLLAMQAALEPLKREVVTVESGNEALLRLLQQEFCLVLLDLQMPGMDGYETAELIRGRPGTRHLPIIFVTAHAPDAEAVLRGYRLNAVDFLFKPINRDVLLAKAGVFVALQEQAEVLAAERARRAKDEARRDYEAADLRHKMEEERAKQEQLARLNEILAENDRRKNAFLAILGHELRNPLAPIRMAVELARGGALTPKLVQIIDRQSATLARLVDDLLDVARINSGRLDLRAAHHDLRSIVMDAVEACRQTTEGREHALDVELPASAVEVEVDGVRILQVLANILGNACRYTPASGRIAVTMRVENGQAIVLIADNGEGIRPELLESIFEMFVGERARTDGYGGLGLGLALARQLVELHRGTLRARSDGPGKGSTFEITLPLAAAIETRRGSRPAAHEAGPRLRLVIVEDGDDARELLAQMLRAEGHDVLTARNGRSGLELIKTQRPDAALIDLGLPDLDGIALAARLRADDPDHPTRLIAVTGYGQEIDKCKTREVGFRAHVVKPVPVEAILVALRSAMKSS